MKISACWIRSSGLRYNALVFKTKVYSHSLRLFRNLLSHLDVFSVCSLFTVHFAIYFKTDSIFALDSIILTWHSSEWLLFSYLQIKNSKTKNTKLKEIVMKQKTIDKSNGSFKFSFQINFVATFEHSSQNTSNIEILCPSRVLDNSKLSTNYDTSYNFERNYFKRILLSRNFAAQFLV